MHKKLERFIAVLEMVGGLFGLIFIVIFYVTIKSQNSLSLSLLGIFSCLYLFSIVAGFFLWRQRSIGIKLSLIVQVLQIPKIISKIFSYFFVVGAGMSVYFSQGDGGGKFKLGWDLILISQFSLPTNRDDILLLVGVNLLAILATIYLNIRMKHRAIASSYSEEA